MKQIEECLWTIFNNMGLCSLRMYFLNPNLSKENRSVLLMRIDNGLILENTVNLLKIL
jgi:hypothetical protein